MTDEVRAALRALATDDRDEEAVRADEEAVRDVVAAATAARADVHAAAAFVADDGLVRLRRAIDRADRRGDHLLADRGRAALAAIERCQRAAADHFRSGRGTVLADGRQDLDR